ncbi:unnamed protein product [Miscanthus lutarioriparius]|uniref:Uncharacterized protein n=1 Tax=Miscanthus lutarioriparius TaxID=422564 RepID=A0A811QI12_9POAL|nr:unnamed protein product [Miscanthus lutarioriparius]
MPTHARAAQPSSSGGLLWLVDDGRIWWSESQMLLPFFSPGSPPIPLSPEARSGERRAVAPPRVVRQRERALMALLPHPHTGGSHPEGPRPGHHRALTIRMTVFDVWRPVRVLPDPATPVVVRAAASTAHKAGPDTGMDWIIHLITDELIHPAGAREYSLRRLLLDVPDNVDMVIFPNYESSIESDDIKDSFTEVSMFKKNYDHLPKDTYFGLYKEATHGNPNYFLTYGNGKSAARAQEHLRPNGAHRWHNYMKSSNEIKLEGAAILHYTYTKFSDLTSRRDRCGCKPTKEDVKRCFILEFDCLAFIIVSTATGEEMKNWYREHVVWTDKDTNLKLLRKGVLTRIYAPMAIIRGLKESGVFTNAVTSAKAQSKIKSSNMDLENEAIQLNGTTGPSTLEGGHEKLQATVRKILEMVDAQKEAMGPMSPLGFLELSESATALS